MQIEKRSVSQLSNDPANARKHSERNIQAIIGSLRRFGMQKPLVIDSSGVVRAGNGTLEAARQLGWETIDCVVTDLKGSDAIAYAIADNRTAELAEWDDDVLAAQLNGLLADDEELLEAAGFSEEEMAALLGELDGDGTTGEHEEEQATTTLAERFMVVPFSVLNAREGWWQDRKRGWLSLGMESELGRDAAVGGSKMVAGYEGGERKTGLVSETDTSIFDPVVCEIAYRWFCPLGGTVLDPFAGGSVRGVVASRLGRRYVGHELRAEQVAANREQAVAICSDPQPEWIHGDSRTIEKTCKTLDADFVFSCPPYADLERYSDDPADLSTLAYDKFLEAYREIIAKACSRLRNDRFACFVVGDVRDKRGSYYNFVGDTVEAFRAAGLAYYNEAILVTAVGSLPIRAGKQFSTSRKLGKTHQNVLVFVKGDGKRAAAACGEVDTVDPAEMFGEVT
jgi:DNA modification methylase